ncbi:MAG: hypothetical protein U0168_01075 [Nannocystaceae bacterium]
MADPTRAHPGHHGAGVLDLARPREHLSHAVAITALVAEREADGLAADIERQRAHASTSRCSTPRGGPTATAVPGSRP